MSGQGSPHIQSQALCGRLLAIRDLHCVGQSLRAVRLFSVCLIGLFAPIATCAETMQLRVTWGQGAAERWQGEFTGPGSFRDMRVLGMQADSLTSLTASASGVRISAASQRVFDGFDIEVEAPLHAEFTMRLARPVENEEAKLLSFRLADLAQPGDFVAEPLDATGNRLHITRTPGDEIHVTVPDDRLVFQPNEAVALEALPRIYRETKPEDLVRRMRLLNAHGKSLWAQEVEMGEDEAVAEAAWPIRFAAPVEQGVYELRLEYWQRSGNLALRAIPDRIYAQRAVRFVVVDAQAASDENASGPANWIPVAEFNANTRSSLWSLARPTALLNASTPLHHGELTRINHPTLGGLSQLSAPSGESEEDPAWIAYPINFARLGEAHSIMVEFPADQHLAMGLSFLERDPRRGWRSVGLDKGVRTRAPSASSAPLPTQDAPLSHEIVVWPRYREGLLLITAPESRTPAIFGKVAVKRLGSPRSANSLSLATTRYSAPSERLPKSNAAPIVTSNTLESAAPVGMHLPRGAAAWFTRGSFLMKYTAPHFTEPTNMLRRGAISTEFDDWQSHYTAVDRWVQSLQYAGYKTVFFNVLAEGSGSLAESLGPTTPRWDTGVFLPQGYDPVRKDVVELMLAMCDREGIVAVPCVVMSQPLEELQSPKHTSHPPVWTNGRNISKTVGNSEIYTPLLEAVRAAQLGWFKKLVNRYGGHSSFSGVCLQLTPADHVHLRNLDWGYDDATIAEFVKTLAQSPGQLSSNGPDRFAQRRDALVGAKADVQLKSQWIAWRISKIQQLYSQMADAVVAAHPGAKLYISVHELLASDSLLTRLRPEPDSAPRADEILAELGLDSKFLASNPHIVLLRPDFEPAQEDGSMAAIAAEIRSAHDLDALAAGANFSVARLQWTSEVQVSELNSQKKGERLPIQYSWTTATQSDNAFYAEALSRGDAALLVDGGPQGKGALSAQAKEWLRIYQSLPPVAFQNETVTAPPIVMRSAVFGGVPYCYLLNPTPWPAKLVLQAENGASPPQPLVETCPEGAWSTGVQLAEWRLELAPYELAAYRIDGAAIRWKGLRIQFPEESTASMQPELQSIWKKASSTANARAINTLPNADFELVEPENGLPLHWTFVPAKNHGSSSSTDARQGEHALHLQSTGPTVQAISERFAPTMSGRLQLKINVKTDNVNSPLHLGLVLEDTVTGLVWAQSLGAGTRYPIDATWKSFQLPVRGLPVSDEKRLRVRLQLSGAGSLWIDDVELHDPRFTTTSEVERSALANVTKGLNDAELQLAAGRPDLTRRFLESYWPRYLRDAVTVEEVEVAGQDGAEKSNLSESTPPSTPRSNITGRLRSFWPWY